MSMDSSPFCTAAFSLDESSHLQAVTFLGLQLRIGPIQPWAGARRSPEVGAVPPSVHVKTGQGLSRDSNSLFPNALLTNHRTVCILVFNLLKKGH